MNWIECEIFSDLCSKVKHQIKSRPSCMFAFVLRVSRHSRRNRNPESKKPGDSCCVWNDGINWKNGLIIKTNLKS